MKAVHIGLVFALVANAVANILIKEGMKSRQVDLSDAVAAFKAVAFNPLVVLGVIFFGLALAAYSFVLSEIKLSVAYPLMTSTGFLIVVSYSFLKLGETVSLVQFGGMLLILAGVWMVASNMG